MIGRIPLLAVLIGSLALSGQAAADHGPNRESVIAGAVVGAVVGGVLASGRYAPAPVYVEVAPPPRVVYYDDYPRYRPYPVVVEHHYYKPRHHKHHRRHHRHDYHDRDYRRW